MLLIKLQLSSHFLVVSFVECVNKSFVWCCTKFKISTKFYFGLLINIQRLRSAGATMLLLQHMIRLRRVEGQNAWSNCILCIPFILSGSPNKCWLHTCDTCIISIWRLGLQAPRAACNKLKNLVVITALLGIFKNLRSKLSSACAMQKFCQSDHNVF